ncbi:hypothetical protein ACUXST_002506 [Sphingomonas sp. F9_3S_D5_B_2]
MAARVISGKLYRLFTRSSASGSVSGERARGVEAMIVGLAVAIFVALFGWGSVYFGWSDPEGKVQLALATSFILGILSGYRAKG